MLRCGQLSYAIGWEICSVEKASQNLTERSGVNPGVRLTCRRFEDEVELFDVKCCLCEESKRLEIIGCRSGAAVAGHLGRKQAKGRSQVYTGEESVHPKPGGGLGLASMGRLNALMGRTTEHRVHSVGYRNPLEWVGSSCCMWLSS